MITINQLYPCGNNFDEYLEYQLICQQCGKPIHIFLPANTNTHSYSFMSNTCHPFNKAIDRGNREFYAHKMIRIYEDLMGGGHSLYDSYHIYPLIDTETIEERKERLIKIKSHELLELMKNNSEKKQWIIKEVVNKNENILNALEPIIKKYEDTPENEWSHLDVILQGIKLSDDANNILERLGLKVRQSNPTVLDTSIMFDANNLFTANNTFINNTAVTIEEKTVSTNKKEDKDSWICTVCGSKVTGKFCSVCGNPSPKLSK